MFGFSAGSSVQNHYHGVRYGLAIYGVLLQPNMLLTCASLLFFCSSQVVGGKSLLLARAAHAASFGLVLLAYRKGVVKPQLALAWGTWVFG